MTTPSTRAKGLENFVCATIDLLHDSPEAEVEPKPETDPKQDPFDHDPHFLATELKHYLVALERLAGEANEIVLDGDDLFALFHTGVEKTEQVLTALEKR